MKPKRDLIRVVKTPEGEIKVDFTGKLNGRGAYTTFWDHATFRAFNDFTEKGVVLLLD